MLFKEKYWTTTAFTKPQSHTCRQQLSWSYFTIRLRFRIFKCRVCSVIWIVDLDGVRIEYYASYSARGQESVALHRCAPVPREPTSHGFEEAAHPETPTMPLGAFRSPADSGNKLALRSQPFAFSTDIKLSSLSKYLRDE